MLARRLAEEDDYLELPQEPQEQKSYVRRRVIRRRVVQRNNLRRHWVVLLLVTACMGFLIIFRESMLSDKTFEITHIRSEATNLETENAKLRITNAQLKNPTRIKETAEKKLGMAVPEQVYFADGK